MIDDYNICPTQSKDSPANHVRLAEGLQELGYRPTYFSTWRSVVEAGWRCPWESYIPSNHFSVPWFWLAECVRKRAHIPLTIFFWAQCVWLSISWPFGIKHGTGSNQNGILIHPFNPIDCHELTSIWYIYIYIYTVYIIFFLSFIINCY